MSIIFPSRILAKINQSLSCLSFSALNVTPQNKNGLAGAHSLDHLFVSIFWRRSNLSGCYRRRNWNGSATQTEIGLSRWMAGLKTH